MGWRPKWKSIGAADGYHRREPSLGASRRLSSREEQQKLCILLRGIDRLPFGHCCLSK